MHDSLHETPEYPEMTEDTAAELVSSKFPEVQLLLNQQDILATMFQKTMDCIINNRWGVPAAIILAGRSGINATDFIKASFEKVYGVVPPTLRLATCRSRSKSIDNVDFADSLHKIIQHSNHLKRSNTELKDSYILFWDDRFDSGFTLNQTIQSAHLPYCRKYSPLPLKGIFVTSVHPSEKVFLTNRRGRSEKTTREKLISAFHDKRHFITDIKEAVELVNLRYKFNWENSKIKVREAFIKNERLFNIGFGLEGNLSKQKGHFFMPARKEPSTLFEYHMEDLMRKYQFEYPICKVIEQGLKMHFKRLRLGIPTWSKEDAYLPSRQQIVDLMTEYTLTLKAAIDDKQLGMMIRPQLEKAIEYNNEESKSRDREIYFSNEVQNKLYTLANELYERLKSINYEKVQFPNIAARKEMKQVAKQVVDRLEFKHLKCTSSN